VTAPPLASPRRKRGKDIRQVTIDVDLTDRAPLLTLDVAGVAALTRPSRERRVELLLEESRHFLARALAELVAPKELAAVGALYSGGGDSTVMAHIFRADLTHTIHANTGVGIEATRQFVRQTSAAWEIPLVEGHPPPGSTYRELVLDRGFPGPGQHKKMFQRLKERAVHAARDSFITNNRRQRVLFLAGRRREESKRRENIPILERRRTIAYVSPIALWHKLDLITYRLMVGDVPVNQVSDLIHMSGECLCGSFAEKGELDEIGWWFPEVRTYIEALEREALAVARTGRFPVERAKWGWGAYRTERNRPKRSASGLMCSSCDARGTAA
jgi:3'-phosphoadenosine 5'-phosphosulfate sulfotransferase (PAPS reductase)/FAD synthetase